MAGLIDYQRRAMMLKAAGAMLNPIKSGYDPMYRIFPTVLMTCTTSMHAWFQMRQCLLDLGRKYVSRIFIYSSTFLGAYLFYAIILFLRFFDMISMTFAPITQTTAIYDIIFTLGNIYGMLYYGAVANMQFVEDQNQLMK
jgi:hypothetical protein